MTATTKPKMCEHCGEIKICRRIKRGMFIGCRVCSQKCKRALLQAESYYEDPHAERRQMGLTAL